MYNHKKGIRDFIAVSHYRGIVQYPRIVQHPIAWDRVMHVLPEQDPEEMTQFRTHKLARHHFFSFGSNFG